MRPERIEELLRRNRELQTRLDEANETLRAIRSGEVDAIVAAGPDGDIVYTLKGADEGYRLLVEQMAEGAVTLTADGLILFANHQLALMLGLPLERVIGSRIYDFVAPAGRSVLTALLSERNGSKSELELKRRDGELAPVYVAANRLQLDGPACTTLVITDLTEQRRNEEIVAAGKLARSILEQAAAAILVLDPNGRIIQANQAAERLAGGSVLLRSFSSAFRLFAGPEAKDLTFEELRSALHKTIAIRGLQAIAHLEGGRVAPVLVSAGRLTTLDSESLGYVITLYDISELKEAEEAMRSSEERLSAELAAMTALQRLGALVVNESNLETVLGRIVESAMSISGADFGNIQLLNPVSSRLEIVAQRGFPQWWVDYWAIVSEGEGSCGASLANRQRVIVEDVEQSPIFAGTPSLDMQRKAGVRSVISTPLCSRSGDLLGMFSTHYRERHVADDRTLRYLDLLAGQAADIIARAQADEALRRSEEHFRRLYDSNIVGIVRANSGQIIDSNDMFLQMTGYTREDLRAGKISWRDVTAAEHSYLDERALGELSTTGSCKPFEKEIVRKDGARLSILLGATALEKSPLTWLGFIVDLTERKELERRLVEKQKLEGIGLLAGGVAHDFNNLLVGILGNASLAQDMVPRSSDVGRILDAIVKTSERAAHLTRQMLAYSGRGQFVIEPVNLSDLVQEMIRLLNPSIPSNVSIQFDLARNLRPVLADSGQLQQIVMNLVINAAEAIGEQPGSISVRTRMRNIDHDFIRRELGRDEIEPGMYVSLEVSDSGEGMDSATVAKIFDPFFTTKFTGRGLGLAAVSGIVRGHKGSIKVTTARGQGTTFVVLLPAAAEAPVEVAKEIPIEDLNGNATVLIVDDEEVVLQTAKDALERHGYSILTAENGAAGIDVLEREKHRVSLIVLDLSMPGMSGQQALPRFRAVKPDVPVIVSSGFSEIEALRVFEGQRVAGFIQKPYTVNRLVEKIKAALSLG